MTRVLTLGEIFFLGVYIYSVIFLTSRGTSQPRSPMAETEERELGSSLDALAVKELSNNVSPKKPELVSQRLRNF